MTSQEQITIKPENLKGEQAVILHIHKEKYKKIRKIGHIKNRTLYTFCNKSNNKFRQLGAIGLNFKFLLFARDNNLIDYICTSHETQELRTSIDYFLHRGFFRHFKKSGIEKQIFLRISDFGMDKANAYENCLIDKLNNEMKNFAQNLKTRSLEMKAIIQQEYS